MTEVASQQHAAGGKDQNCGSTNSGGGKKFSSGGDDCIKDEDSRRTPSPLRQLVGFRKLGAMWHPHVYQTPVSRPTPFSIDDILNSSRR